jgi:16S rRNA (uracil1498-N3)-methyltransferase
MTRRRWIADEYSATNAALTGANAGHLARTLRARVGQQFDVACGERVYQATVSSVADSRVEFALGDEVFTSGDSIPVQLFLAVFKFDRMEWAIEKCTELGVAAITPVIAPRTEPHLAGAAQKRVERWRRIAREASEQSRRAQPPTILLPCSLAEFLAQVDGARILLAEHGENSPLRGILQKVRPPVTLAIGPEGGWSDGEVRAFTDAGWVAASLGATILRAETAAMVAVALTFSEYG